jgi:hypothetical protein
MGDDEQTQNGDGSEQQAPVEPSSTPDLPEAEAAHDRNPAAQEALTRGLADANAGRIYKKQLRSA